MRVTLDEHGIAVPDAQVQRFVDHHLLFKMDIHVSNELVILVLRAALFQKAIQDRPYIKWIFYGKDVHFDKDMRSGDAWQDPRTCVAENALTIML